MERWQKIERCLMGFFRNQENFEVHQQGDVFANFMDGGDDELGLGDLGIEFNLTLLAKDIDSEIEYDAKKDFSNSIDACYDEIKNRVATGGPGMKSK